METLFEFITYLSWVGVIVSSATIILKFIGQIKYNKIKRLRDELHGKFAYWTYKKELLILIICICWIKSRW